MESDPRFQFSVKTSKDDYIRFNEFMTLRSPYNKHYRLRTRLTVPCLVLIIFLLLLILKGFTIYTASMGVFYFIVTVLYEISIPFSTKRDIRRNINRMEKSEKRLYSAEGKLEFHDDSFTEITPEVKSEYKYTAIDRISIVGEADIYIHLDRIITFIVPVSSIGSDGEKIEFVSFLKGKCKKIDIYK